MSLSISQIAAASFNDVVAKKRKAENQWAESALMRWMEKQGMIDHRSFGPSIEAPLDYRRNAGGAFLANELQPMSMSATEILTAASFDPAELSVPVVWSKKTEVTNPSVNQKIDVVDQMMTNGLDTHDELIEEALFATSTNGFLGLGTHAPTSGQGSDGGIDSSVETFWRLVTATYVDDTDMEASLTSAWNSASKGSGSKLQPTLLVSDGATNALFEGTQQGLQRYSDGQEFKAGAKSIMFKTAPYIFSQYGGTSVYGLNSTVFKLAVSKEYFRAKGETKELENANGFEFKIYSALQTIVTNRSRLFVVHV